MIRTAEIDLKAYCEEKRRFIDELLVSCLPGENEEPISLHRAMRYTVMAGGKRLRPILAIAAFEHCGGDVSDQDHPIHLAAAALEFVHTYSLIHDDLPCMDDDDLRRGKPTCHKVFGEAVAVLAGDALHDVAYGLMARTGDIRAIEELSEAIGSRGMIGGQVADVEAEGKEIDCDSITLIHQRKTGALIRCAVRVGALLAKADEPTLARLGQYGTQIGLAFQIVDDILDIEGDQDLLGKKVGADDELHKATYPGAVGMEQSRKDVSRIIDEAIAALEEPDGCRLAQIAKYIGERSH